MAIPTKEVKINGIMGDFYQFVLGDKVDGASTSGSTVLPKGFYIVDTIASTSSAIPTKTGTSGNNIEKGDPFYSDGSITLASGDAAYPVVIINRTDIATWSLEGSAATGTATTFADIRTSLIERQLTGLVTLSGSMTGVNTINVSDTADWSLNSYFPITKIDGKDSATHWDAHNPVKYGLFVTNKDTQNKTVPLAFMIAPFQFAGASIAGDPTSADGTQVGGDFIIASDSEVRLNYVVCGNTDDLYTLYKAQA